MLVARKCEHCGCEYHSQPQRNIRYCSRQCWREARKAIPQTIVCQACGKVFLRPKNRIGKGMYCSLQCAGRHMKRKPAQPKTYVCQVCGKPFQDSHYNRKFCSRECADKGREQHHTIMETLQCPVCGQSFERPALWKSKSTRKQFCSKACFYEFRRQSTPPVICKNCGVEFHVIPSQRARPYCSPDCYIEYKTTHYPYTTHSANLNLYGLNWPEQRESRRRLDNYCCQSCGIHERDLHSQLHVHHVTPFRAFGIERYQEANRLDNLVSLCSDCHKKLEHDSQTSQFLAIRNFR